MDLRHTHCAYSLLDLTLEPADLPQLDSRAPDGSKQLPSSLIHLDKDDGSTIKLNTVVKPNEQNRKTIEYAV